MCKTNIITYIMILIISGCAGTEGQPQQVKALLEDRYIGKEIDVAVLNLGAPDSIVQLPSRRKVYTWRRQTDKYKNNIFIKSDERCVITFMTDTEGYVIETVGDVDDSLGAWQLSYCAEQLGL